MGSRSAILTLGFFGGPLVTLGMGSSVVIVGGHGQLCIGSITVTPALTCRVRAVIALHTTITVTSALTCHVRSEIALQTSITVTPAITCTIRGNSCNCDCS